MITTGMTEEQAAAVHRNERPLLVYVYGDAASERDEDPRVAVEEDAAFRDERVVVGARFFDCVRIHEDDARQDGTLKRFAAAAPCLVFVRPDFTAEKSLRGRFDAARIFAAMCATVEKDYANCLKKTLKEQEKLEDALVAVYGRRAELGAMEQRLADEKDAAKRKQLQEKRDGLEAEVRAAEESLAAQEKALYELKPRTGA